MSPKVGQYISTSGTNLKMEILQVDKGGDLVVNVDRRVITKDGEIKIDTRERLVPASVVPFFIRGYEFSGPLKGH